MTNAGSLGLLPLLLLVSCGPATHEQARLGPVESMERLMVPPDAEGGCVPPVNDANSVTVTCDRQFPGARNRTETGFTADFLIVFEGGKSGKAAFLLTRYDNGETQEIDIVMNSVSDSRTRLRITLRVYAD